MWKSQIMGGKDWPHERVPKDTSLLGKIVGLILQVFEPIFGSVKCDI